MSKELYEDIQKIVKVHNNKCYAKFCERPFQFLIVDKERFSIRIDRGDMNKDDEVNMFKIKQEMDTEIKSLLQSKLYDVKLQRNKVKEQS
jgi:hypothetical protein